MASPTPRGLGRRGKALWKHYGFDAGTPEGVLALEAARAADTLDNLFQEEEGLLQTVSVRLSDYVDWEDERQINVTVQVDKLLSEIRAQQNNLRQILLNLGLVAFPAKGSGSTSDGIPATETPTAPPSKESRSSVDEFTQRRRARRGAS